MTFKEVGLFLLTLAGLGIIYTALSWRPRRPRYDPDPHMRNAMSFWKIKCLEYMRELPKANKGLRRLRAKLNRAYAQIAAMKLGCEGCSFLALKDDDRCIHDDKLGCVRFYSVLDDHYTPEQPVEADEEVEA